MIANAETQPDIEDKTPALRSLVQRITEELTTAALLIFCPFCEIFVVNKYLQSCRRVKRSTSTTLTTAAANNNANFKRSIKWQQQRGFLILFYWVESHYGHIQLSS
jgi:hypothetical protein